MKDNAPTLKRLPTADEEDCIEALPLEQLHHGIPLQPLAKMDTNKMIPPESSEEFCASKRQQRSSFKKSGQRLLKKSVSISESEPDVHPIEHVSNISKKEAAKRWIKNDEWSGIQAENANVIYLMDKGMDLNSDKTGSWTTRGLERLTEEGMIHFTEERYSALLAVLDQQDTFRRQGGLKTRDPSLSLEEFIAEAYCRETARTSEQAAKRGQLDAAEAAEYLADCEIKSVRRAQLERIQKGRNQKRLMHRLTKPLRIIYKRSASCPVA